MFEGIAIAAEQTGDTTVHLGAKNIKLNQASGSITYTGNVRLFHKTLAIRGSRATASAINQGEKYVMVTGSPVTAVFIDNSGRQVALSSNSVHYDSRKGIVTALEKARLKSEDGIISAYKIEYELATDRFSVSGEKNSPRISALLNIYRPPASKQEK